VVACDLPDLLGLLVDDVRDVVEVVIDQLPVGLVDEGGDENGRGG
jgi:hypothetical protein